MIAGYLFRLFISYFFSVQIIKAEPEFRAHNPKSAIPEREGLAFSSG
jgi:hypothetical protein